jgi:transposase InsO family protein
VPAASLHSEATTENVQEALSDGRTPRQILSDHGTQYFSNDGPGRFTDFCETHGIEHIHGSIGKPTTQGKIQRFFQTFMLYYPRFNDMPRFVEHYKRSNRIEV